MLKKILIGVVAVLVIVVVVIALQPSTFTVTRSTTVNAAPAAIYPLISDFKSWETWSPWEKLDPAMKKELGGTQGAVGATYHWTSEQENVGEGRMTITAMKPNESLDIRLEFMKPFPAENQIQFVLAAKDAATDVTWTMTGGKNFMMKAMCLVVSMDKMIGPDFEKGLAALKTQAESGAAAATAMTSTTAGGASTGDEVGSP